MMNVLTMYMMPKINLLDITFQFELVKAMSRCIIWILNIHDLYVNELNYLDTIFSDSSHILERKIWKAMESLANGVEKCASGDEGT